MRPWAAGVSFAVVARRAVDVVRLPLAMIGSPSRDPVVVRLGGELEALCRAALTGLAPALQKVYLPSLPSTGKVYLCEKAHVRKTWRHSRHSSDDEIATRAGRANRHFGRGRGHHQIGSHPEGDRDWAKETSN